MQIPAPRFSQYDYVYFSLRRASGKEMLFKDSVVRRSYEIDVGTWWYKLEVLDRWAADQDLYAEDALMPQSALRVD